MSKKVSDILPKMEILAQLAEEASELAQAALKLRRALDAFRWWMEDDNISGQLSMDDLMEDNNV